MSDPVVDELKTLEASVEKLVPTPKARLFTRLTALAMTLAWATVLWTMNTGWEAVANNTNDISEIKQALSGLVVVVESNTENLGTLAEIVKASEVREQNTAREQSATLQDIQRSIGRIEGQLH